MFFRHHRYKPILKHFIRTFVLLLTKEKMVWQILFCKEKKPFIYILKEKTVIKLHIYSILHFSRQLLYIASDFIRRQISVTLLILYNFLIIITLIKIIFGTSRLVIPNAFAFLILIYIISYRFCNKETFYVTDCWTNHTV